MSPFVRQLPRFWFVVPLLALGFLLWIDHSRAERVEFVSGFSSTAATLDSTSPTGYAGGVRMLIAPGHNNESYQWILQTQRIIADGRWRLRHVDYDNASLGRDVQSPSPYRWWLAFVGWCDHVFSGRSIGLAVERGAIWADPVLHLLALLTVVGFVWRGFGALPALLVSLAMASLFPLAAGFVPGAPDGRNLAQLALFASVLTLVRGILKADPSRRRTRQWFVASGALGSVAIWLSVAAVPVLVGLGAGALGAAWLNRRQTTAALPWRAWSIAGASATLVAYLLEYAPSHLESQALRLTEVHPLYALAWLGGGELLVRLSAMARGEKPDRRAALAVAGAVIAFVSVPAVMWLKHDQGFLLEDTFVNRLTLLDDTPGADNFAKWMVQGGLSAALLATCFPLALLGVGAWQLCRSKTAAMRRVALAVVLLPALVALMFAWAQLSWWNTFDYLLLAVLVVATFGIRFEDRIARRWLVGAIIVLAPGLVALWPASFNAAKPKLTRTELEGQAERDFAQWLARRRGPDGGIVLAPPNVTVSLIFHGGLRGLGTPYRENEDGFRVSVRLAGAVHVDEAQALARQRGVTDIAIPSWDGFLDEYARLGGGEIEHSFLGLLHSWLAPRWLRPVPYYMPKLAGFENEQVFLFEQTEIQDNPTSLSRLGEYFIDMGQLDLSAQVAQALAHEFAADLGGQIARARTELVRNDHTAFAKSIASISAALADNGDDALLWDRRVSLSLVLAAAGRNDLAKAQAQRCLDEMGEFELRQLSEPTLFRFLVLCRGLGLTIEDPKLHELARALLPTPLRAQI